MKPAPFDHAAPTSLAEALALLRQNEDSRPLAGGQSLAPMLALRLARPSLVVDLNRVAELSGVAFRDGVLRIGAMTRQASVLTSPEIAAHAPLLIDALHNVGHPPTRARGTIGGSLAHADPAAELPVAMVALDATMVIATGHGERRIAASDFFLGAFETALQPGEILVAVELAFAPGGTGFVEVSPRKGDFAIVSAAARIALDAAGLCAHVALVLGGVGEAPLRCADAEAALKGKAIGAHTLDAALKALPLEDITMESRLASAAYRRKIAPVMARRALEAALAKAKGARP